MVVVGEKQKVIETTTVVSQKKAHRKLYEIRDDKCNMGEPIQ